jgi:hypothetical protein
MGSVSEFLASHQTLAFYSLLAVALLLTRIPVIGKYFRGINTMIHESGHAVVTLMVSGEIISVNLFSDTSGTTVTKAKNKFFQIVISLAGYPASAITAFIFMLLLNKGYDLYILFVMVSITLLLLVLSIRNTYGIFWAGTFSLLNLLLIYYNHAIAISIAAKFFTLVIFTDGLISSITLLALSIKTPNKAGDASNLQKFTRIPAVVWAIILLGISVFLAYLTIAWYFPALSNLI